jgi:hypothetical protein
MKKLEDVCASPSGKLEEKASDPTIAAVPCHPRKFRVTLQITGQSVCTTRECRIAYPNSIRPQICFFPISKSIKNTIKI